MHQHLEATGTHTSLIAHITQRELAQNLHRTEAHNGFANRCLWAWVQRSNCLPEGGSLSPNELSIVACELCPRLREYCTRIGETRRRAHCGRGGDQETAPAEIRIMLRIHVAASQAHAQPRWASPRTSVAQIEDSGPPDARQGVNFMKSGLGPAVRPGFRWRSIRATLGAPLALRA